ncbi:MAG: ECF transporter S component, partial [Firmicutes bacterium]|nr:ECF transporter S component [Candidatus Fermentithermobacillaceae bacterium]
MRLEVRRLVYTAVLAALAVAFQLGTLPQAFTGPAINTILYVASIFVGPFSGVIVGFITPWVALMTGIMKLAPAVPVIMIGNASLALVSGYGSRLN